MFLYFLQIYIEYSNEVWNGIFRQTRYTQEEGTKLGLDPHSYRAGMMYYNKRSVEVMNIWKSVHSIVFFVYKQYTSENFQNIATFTDGQCR